MHGLRLLSTGGNRILAHLRVHAYNLDVTGTSQLDANVIEKAVRAALLCHVRLRLLRVAHF